MKPQSRIGLLQVCVAAVLWGTSGLVMTTLHDRDGLGAMTVGAWRMVLAAAALLIFVAVTGRLGSVRQTMHNHPTLTVVIGAGTALHQGLYFSSVLMVGVSVSTVVALGLAPVLAATAEHLLARTRPSIRDVGVLAAALAGLILISLNADHGAPAPLDRPGLGVALAIAAGFVYATTTVLGHTMAKQVEPVALTTATTCVGALTLAPFLAVALAAGEPAIGLSTGSLALLFYLGTATMALSYGLLYAGLRTTPGSAATIATLLEPIAAGALAALLLGERLGPAGIVGAVLILAAVVALRPEPQPPVAN
ncbi:MAG TPA: DMT family transporter [Aeromicrobium sp.]|nr:DMT family transporter [Aeromicrobium sp.]